MRQSPSSMENSTSPGISTFVSFCLICVYKLDRDTLFLSWVPIRLFTPKWVEFINLLGLKSPVLYRKECTCEPRAELRFPLSGKKEDVNREGFPEMWQQNYYSLPFWNVGIWKFRSKWMVGYWMDYEMHLRLSTVLSATVDVLVVDVWRHT